MLSTVATDRKQLDATAAVREDPKPIWHRQFSINFNETTKLLWWRWSTEGSMLYDALQQVEVVHRANGKGDSMCLSIHPRSDTPCTHLVVSGQRYLIFPELGECCKCCSNAGGCGILDPNWLDAAEYTGQTTMQGRTADSWTIRGLQPNNYYATADVPVGIPLELDQLPTATYVFGDYITFHPDTLNLGPVSPKDVIVPEGCAEKCPLTSVCTILQAKASLQMALGWRGRGRGAQCSSSSSSRADLGGRAAAVV
uniref:Uncharacterized protein n=1 Tax=Tetradesmus obliquus TaxID=3088 RepID=A0A383W200_TETOB|eukprot:jgi/Sobl393_1/7823/SZX71153.1